VELNDLLNKEAILDPFSVKQAQQLQPDPEDTGSAGEALPHELQFFGTQLTGKI
jgi:hypothetical protein